MVEKFSWELKGRELNWGRVGRDGGQGEEGQDRWGGIGQGGGGVKRDGTGWGGTGWGAFLGRTPRWLTRGAEGLRGLVVSLGLSSLWLGKSDGGMCGALDTKRGLGGKEETKEVPHHSDPSHRGTHQGD